MTTPASTTPAHPTPGAPGAPPVEGPPGMVHVPAGVFKFGPKNTPVDLTEFWIDLTPVTNGEYARFLTTKGRRQPGHWPSDGLPDAWNDLPLVNITYADAEAYATAVGKLLPTPAQFEKAARGVDGAKYPWGDTVGLRTSNTRETGLDKATPVQQYPRGRSPFGCWDMAGNVLCWTRGVHDKAKGSMTVKGASFRTYLGPVAWSHERAPTAKQDDLGLRCVWVRPLG
jgi:formylglycine-generating enzyme required for sulfatase activity